ncbi:hypothetical protein SCUP515_13265 [Seiridium cupressi]
MHAFQADAEHSASAYRKHQTELRALTTCGMRPYPSSVFEMQEEKTRQALYLYSFFHDSRDSAVRPGPGFVHGLSIRPLQCQCNSTRLSLAQPEHREVSTVIEETLSILNGHPEDACHSPCMEDCPVTISSKTLALGVTILRHVPYPEDGHRLFRKEATIYDGWIRVVTRHILDSFYDEWGSYLGRNRSLPKLEEMARRICVNTAKSVAKKVDANEWLDQFRGPNLRWESLGLMFNYWDLLDKLNEIRYPAGHVPLSYYAPTTQESIMLCLEMAQEYSDGNPFTVHLSLRRAVLESLISGDASRQTWKFLADAVASLTFLGMHAEPFDDSYQPTFYSEISRRVLLPVFTIDKVQLAFTGRPPLLFRKFITTPMPLDIKDEDLFLDQKSLIEKVRTTVDDKGWNTEGGFYSATYIRARYIMAQFREQIAEIALGNDRQATVDDLLQIKAKQDTVESEFPSVLLWRQEEVTEPEERTMFMFSRLLLKLDMLQNDFFLYRLLLRRGSPDEGCLLYTSFQMVSLVLNLWTHMDRFSRMRPDFEWLSNPSKGNDNRTRLPLARLFRRDLNFLAPTFERKTLLEHHTFTSSFTVAKVEFFQHRTPNRVLLLLKPCHRRVFIAHIGLYYPSHFFETPPGLSLTVPLSAMVLGKRKADSQGGREFTAPELARHLIESMHRLEVWGKLKELEFYIHLSPHTDLNRAERDAVADCLECKFAEGTFDQLQRDFMSKLTQLEKVVRGRYDHINDFLRPWSAPSKTEMTNHALRSLDATNVSCLKDLLILGHAHRINKVRDDIIHAMTKKVPMTFEDTRNVTLDIQEFVSHLYPWQRQILFLHLLTSKNKPHPAEIAWAQPHSALRKLLNSQQDALISPGIAQLVHGMMHERQSPQESSALKNMGSSIDLVIHQATYQQAGLMAATLRADAAMLDKNEMDALISQIREAQDIIKGQS